MSDQQNTQQGPSLDEVNDVLTRGLRLCHSLIDDYRSKFASSLNGNEEIAAANDDDVENDESDRA